MYGEEGYYGARFKTIFQGVHIDHSAKMDELLSWSRKLGELGMGPKLKDGYAGNISFRTPRGFIITAYGASLREMRTEDLVLVTECRMPRGEDLGQGLLPRAYVVGRRSPSSETLIHHMIYKKRSDINAIFHGHDTLILRYVKELGIAETLEEHPYGTPELLNQVLTVLMRRNCIVMKNHGFLTLGRNIRDAGDLAVKKHTEALRLFRSHGVA